MRKHREHYCLNTTGWQEKILEASSGRFSTEPEFLSKRLGFIWAVMPRTYTDVANTWKMNVKKVKHNDLTGMFITNKPMYTQVTVGKAGMTNSRDGLPG